MSEDKQERYYKLSNGLRHELMDYFDGMADADQPAGAPSPIPNEEMRLYMELNELPAYCDPIVDVADYPDGTSAPVYLSETNPSPTQSEQPTKKELLQAVDDLPDHLIVSEQENEA